MAVILERDVQYRREQGRDAVLLSGVGIQKGWIRQSSHFTYRIFCRPARDPHPLPTTASRQRTVDFVPIRGYRIYKDFTQGR